MKRLALAAAIGLLGVGVAAAQDVQEATAKERYDALMKKYESARDAWTQRYRAAKTNEARMKLRAEQPNIATHLPELWEIVEAAAAEPFAAQALRTITSIEKDAAKQDKAFGLLIKHHGDSEEAKVAARTVTKYRLSDGGIQLLEHLVDSTKGDEQGQFRMQLAEVLAAAGGFARQFSGPAGKECIDYYGKYIGVEQCKKLAKADADKLEKKAADLLETVIEEHADVSLGRRGGTLGEKAKKTLFELRNLSIGKPAPDIAAEDIDGVEFKLSDYRGKVVMLDFWGDW